MSFQIAIDGPAGAGKSTVAKLAASALGFLYVDTGAMYRAAALFLEEHGTDMDDTAAMERDVQEASISLRLMDDGQHIFLDGEDVTGRIRTEKMGMLASRVSACAGVRKYLVRLQQEIAAEQDVVMDGRDIGTVVLPQAPLKIYLTASVEARAERRLLELREKGENPDPEKVRMDIEQRDYQDTHRKESPRRQAEDAVYLDTSDCTAEEAAQRILELYRERANGSI